MNLTRKIFCCLTFVAVFIYSCSDSDSPLAPEMSGEDPAEFITDPFELNGLLGRGVNLGNALEAPAEGEWGVTLDEYFFPLIKNAGFDAVRIPIRWSAHAMEAAPYTIDPAFMSRVQWAVEQSLDAGLAVVINVHHYEELMENPAAHKVRFLAIWQQVAAHFQDHSGLLLFELLNEPFGFLTPQLWNEYLEEAIAIVRQTNPQRTLIIGGGFWNAIQSLDQLRLPEDDRQIIVSIHYYLPLQFTHQGAEWVPGSESWLGTLWLGTAEEKQAILRDFEIAVSWAQSHDRPLYLGEFGAYSKADLTSRVRWTKFVVQTARAHDISFAYWEFCAGFGVYDKSSAAWIQPILYALLP